MRPSVIFVNEALVGWGKGAIVTVINVSVCYCLPLHGTKWTRAEPTSQHSMRRSLTLRKLMQAPCITLDFPSVHMDALLG